MKFVLTIAGSDPTGGAGIQADLKTISALGCYGLSAVTAITSQKSNGVQEYVTMDTLALKSQIDNLYSEFRISAVKTGMLGTVENLKIISQILSRKNQKNIVVDPIILSGTGVKLIEDKGVNAYKYALFPIATIITPNLNEASIFTGIKIRTVEEMMIACRKLAELGPSAVVVKGGHLAGDPVDVLFYRKKMTLLPQKRIKKNVHGAGCTFSSAIASLLALGIPLEDAVRSAQQFTSMCIMKGFKTKGGGKYLLKHL
jgi:hydroxymethylpyrimidine/phosphomethylpyrimidine kinase